MHVPIIRQLLPFSEPFSHERPMFRFFDRNREISAEQIVNNTLAREPIGPERVITISLRACNANGEIGPTLCAPRSRRDRVTAPPNQVPQVRRDD